VADYLPADVDADVVEPAVSGTVYKVFAATQCREIFSTKAPEIQQVIEKVEVAPRRGRDLSAEGRVRRQRRPAS
jgi:hypothetical protein